MNTEEIDMRGLSLSERKDLLGWYMVNEPSLTMQGELANFEWLRSIEGQHPEFVKHALREFIEEGEEADVCQSGMLPKPKKNPSGYV